MVEERKRRKESVYIHCKAGKGRSALVTSCYLVKVCHMHVTIEAANCTHEGVISRECTYHVVATVVCCCCYQNNMVVKVLGMSSFVYDLSEFQESVHDHVVVAVICYCC